MDMQMLAALMSPPDVQSIRKLLCIQPHPDDNEIGMGGIIAKLTAQGCRVDYLTVTDGALGDIGLTDGSRSLAEVRAEETRTAGKYLGVTHFIDLKEPDGSLGAIPALAEKIAEILRAGEYDGVACPDPWNTYEAHRDHVVTGLAAAQAALRNTH